MNQPYKPAYLGIDLGGSKSFAIAFDDKLEIIVQDKIATEAAGGYDHVIARLKDQIARLEKDLQDKDYALKGIGIGMPGIIAPDGFLKIAPNLNWQNVRPLESLALDPNIKTTLLNDVNAGLMGELTRLSPPPLCTVAFFCGTGIGGAVAYDGKLLLGGEGGAGEVGHFKIRKGGRRCGCGCRGCLEAHIGKWGLNSKILARIKSKKGTMLNKIINYDLRETPVKSSSLKKAYKRGDRFTLALMNNYYARNLAMGISQAVNFLNPNLVILGGGIMESLGEELLTYVENYLPRYCINSLPQLKISELGDLAGPIGAASQVMPSAGG